MLMKPQRLRPMPAYYFTPAYRGAPIEPDTEGEKLYKSRKMEGVLGGFFNVLLAGERVSGTLIYAARKGLGFDEIEWIEKAEPGTYGYRRISPSEALGLKGYDDKFWTPRGIASFAIDILLDPTTYIGIGLTGKTAKIGKMGITAVTGEQLVSRGGIRVGEAGIDFIEATMARGISRETAERKLVEYMGRNPKIQAEMMARGGVSAVKFMGRPIMETARVTEPMGKLWRAAPYLEKRIDIVEGLKTAFVPYHRLTTQLGEWAAKPFKEYYRKTGVGKAKWEQYVAQLAKGVPEEWYEPIVRYVELGETPTSNVAEITRLGDIYRAETSRMAEREVARGILEEEAIRPYYYARVPTEEAIKFVRKERGKEFGEGLTEQEMVSKYMHSLHAKEQRAIQENIFVAEEIMRKKTGVKQWYVFNPFESLQRRGVESIMALESKGLWDEIVNRMGVEAVAKTKHVVSKKDVRTQLAEFANEVAEGERSISSKIEQLVSEKEERLKALEEAKKQLKEYPEFSYTPTPRMTKRAAEAKEKIPQLIKNVEEWVAKHPQSTRNPIDEILYLNTRRIQRRVAEEELIRLRYKQGFKDIERLIEESKSKYAESIKLSYAKKQQEYIDSMRAVGEFANVLEDLRIGVRTTLPSEFDLPPGTFTPKQLERYLEIRERVGTINPKKMSPASAKRILSIVRSGALSKETLASDVTGLVPFTPSREAVLKAAKESDVAERIGLTRFVERVAAQSKKKEQLFYEAERKLKIVERGDILLTDLPKSERLKIERFKKKIEARGTEEEYLANELRAYDIKESKYYAARVKKALRYHSKYLSLARMVETQRKILFEGTRPLKSEEELIASARAKYDELIKPLKTTIDRESRAIDVIRAEEEKARQKLYEWKRLVPEREKALRKKLEATKELPLEDYVTRGGITYKLEGGYYVPTEAVAEYRRRIPKSGWWSHLEAQFKKTLTSIWPAFHARNLYGMVLWQNVLAGVDPRAYVMNLDIMRKTSSFLEKHAAWAMGDVNKLYDIPFMGKKTAAQLREIAEQQEVYGITGMVDIDVTHTTKLAKGENTLERAKNFLERKYEQVPQEIMVGVESTGRGALFWDRIMKGETVEKAAEEVEKFHFRYGPGSLTEFESGTMRHFFLFYRWMRGNVPLQAKMSLEKPGMFAALAKIQERSMSPEDRGRLKSWQKDKFGFNVGGTFVSLDIPFYEHPMLFFDPRQLGNLYFAVTPAIKFPSGILAGREPTTGAPIETWRQRWEYALSQFAGRGVYAQRELAKTWSGERPVSWTVAHQIGGVGVYEIPQPQMYEGMTPMPRLPGSLKKQGVTQEVWTEWQLARGWKPRLTTESRFEIYQEEGGRCSVCGQPCTPEHPCTAQLIIPVEMGGTNTPDNTVLVHKSCAGTFRQNIAPMMARDQEGVVAPMLNYNDKSRLWALMDEWNEKRINAADLAG